MNLKNESKTLFIPLYGKAKMSEKNLFLHDPKAEEIIANINYNFKSLKQSKWLSMFMSLRALIIDELCNSYLDNNKNVTVIHLGCGLDSRSFRINNNYNNWYDIDYDNVIKIRKNYFKNNKKYQMLGCSVTEYKWINKIDKTDNILLILEGLTMYLDESEIKELLLQVNKKFKNVHLIFDAFTKKGVNSSKIKNPVNRFNAKIKYGLDRPEDFLKLNKNLELINVHLIKKDDNDLKGITKFIFNNLYCGKVSQSLYKIYEFKLK